MTEISLKSKVITEKIINFNPISKLENKDIKEYYPYPDILSEGVDLLTATKQQVRLMR